MALDGIVMSNIVRDLNKVLINGRIYKIAQPENDELLLTVKNNKEQYRLLLSAGASLPFLYLTDNNKPSPLTAPNFCMLLRKHINNGRIISITQPGLERIIDIEIEHLDELGDPRKKHLIVEIMGKHSNIIFCNEDNMIIDSIKHISHQISSIREVLPGRPYFIPETKKKCNPLTASHGDIIRILLEAPQPLSKAIYTSFTGISPVIAEEMCFRASIESDKPANTLSDNEQVHFTNIFLLVMDMIKKADFTPNIIYKSDEPVEFSSVPLTMYQDMTSKSFTSISALLETYYSSREIITRIRQKSVDLRKIVQTALERTRKKYDLQLNQIKDTKKKDKYRIYGELINTYGYHAEPGAKSLEAHNYYTDEMINIPLDPTISVIDNGKKYFDKYTKLKRTDESLSKLVKETKAEITHLESINTALDLATALEDLIPLKKELMEYGYIKNKHSKKQEKVTSKPFHYISSDGYHMYVGKNNYQNEELTFKFAIGEDWWFHAKGIPGSHVIVKSNGEMPSDRTFEEAGMLAAYYSKGRNSDKVEIDYTEKKNVKKPSGGKPGFVVYYTNYSLLAEPDITNIKEVNF